MESGPAPDGASRYDEDYGLAVLSRPQKIALADLDAIVAQDVVGGGGVEIEVRQAKTDEDLFAGQFHGGAAHRQLDDARLGAVELLGFEALHILQHGRD